MEKKAPMTNIWKKGANDYESSAKVVDGNLIISLPDAVNPIVWRMELGSVKASALEVRAHATDGTFLLLLKTPKGDVHEIAPFASKELAVTALMRVSSAMQGAEGRLAPLAPASVSSVPLHAPQPVFHKPDAGAVKWLLALAGVLAVIFLFAYLAKSTPTLEAAGVPMADTATSTATGAPNAESGVPQSADDVLRGF